MDNNVDFIRFYPCGSSSDLSSPGFHYSPLFTHHFFLNEFKFDKFKFLNIGFFYSVNSLHTHLDVSGEFIDSLSDEEFHPLLSDLEKSLFYNLPFPGGFSSKTQLSNLLDHPIVVDFNSTPIHQSIINNNKLKIFSFKPSTDNTNTNTNTTNNTSKFIINGRNFNLIDLPSLESDESPLLLHRRAEWHCHWFIESMSNIIYDKSWEIFLPLLDDNLDSNESNKSSVSVIGLITCYHFFTIDRTRFRISQFFIFPQWQRRGFGTKILKVIYERALDDPEIREIAVEDPSPEFTHIRDLVGLEICLDKKLISKDNLKDSDKSILPKEIARICKESKTQASRLAEIIMLASVKSEEQSDCMSEEQSDCMSEEQSDCMSEEFSEIRLKTKKRLKVEREEELACVDNFKELLSDMWKESFRDYSKTITKMRKTCRI